MVSATSLSLFLLAGTALAAPRDLTLNKRCGEMINSGQWGSFPNCWGACASDPACNGGGQPAAPPQQPQQPPQQQQPPPQQHQDPPKQQPQPQPQTTTTTTNNNGGGNTGNNYIDIVNKYRGIMGKNHLNYDSKLQGNIQKTLNDHPGAMVHELNPGTGGQVLAQGNCGDFTSALVFGWICERPELLPAGSCNGGNYNLGGQTGHADILKNNDYKTAACACSNGIWGCDFGS